jgi:predicted ester cyclase
VDATDLERTYRQYLTHLDERRFDALDAFVHDELTYNGRPMTRQQYADHIAASTDAAPDLRFVAELLVVQGDLVASRLAFDCTPVATFLGRQPTGRRVRFAEHVLYHFEDGRIRQVWSLLDEGAVTDQMRPPRSP